jgi:hypothetical protein
MVETSYTHDQPSRQQRGILLVTLWFSGRHDPHSLPTLEVYRLVRSCPRMCLLGFYQYHFLYRGVIPQPKIFGAGIDSQFKRSALYLRNDSSHQRARWLNCPTQRNKHSHISTFSFSQILGSDFDKNPQHEIPAKIIDLHVTNE